MFVVENTCDGNKISGSVHPFFLSSYPSTKRFPAQNPILLSSLESLVFAITVLDLL